MIDVTKLTATGRVVFGTTVQREDQDGDAKVVCALVPLTTFRTIWMGRPELFVFIKAPDSRHMLEL